MEQNFLGKSRTHQWEQDFLNNCRAFHWNEHNVLITNAPKVVVEKMWKMDVTEGLKYLHSRGFKATWMTPLHIRV